MANEPFSWRQRPVPREGLLVHGLLSPSQDVAFWPVVLSRQIYPPVNGDLPQSVWSRGYQFLLTPRPAGILYTNPILHVFLQMLYSDQDKLAKIEFNFWQSRWRCLCEKRDKKPTCQWRHFPLNYRGCSLQSTRLCQQSRLLLNYPLGQVSHHPRSITITYPGLLFTQVGKDHPRIFKDWGRRARGPLGSSTNQCSWFSRPASRYSLANDPLMTAVHITKHPLPIYELILSLESAIHEGQAASGGPHRRRWFTAATARVLIPGNYSQYCILCRWFSV